MRGRLVRRLRRLFTRDDAAQRESLELSRAQVALAGRQLRIAVITLVVTVATVILAIWQVLPRPTPNLSVDVTSPDYRSRIVTQARSQLSKPPQTTDKPEDRCAGWRSWYDDRHAAFPADARFGITASAPTQSGATITKVELKVTKSFPVEAATEVICRYAPPSDRPGAPRADLSRDSPSVVAVGSDQPPPLPFSLAAGTTASIPFVVTGEPRTLYEWVATVTYRIGNNERQTILGTAKRPFRSYVGYTGRLERVVYSDATSSWQDADRMLPRTDYVYLTADGIARLPIGAPESDVLAYLRALLGPPDETTDGDIKGCTPGYRHRNYRWGNLGVSFVMRPGAAVGRLSGFDLNVSFAEVDLRTATPKNAKLFGQLALGDPATEVIRSNDPATVADERSGTKLTVIGYRRITPAPGDYYGVVVYATQTGAFSGAFTHVPEATGLCHLERWTS